MKWPADKVERWPLERLTPRARNPRTHSDAQIEQVARSMREFGWTNPVLVDEGGEIIAGHGRVLAARSLGYTEAPVMIATGWSEDQKRAYVIADNQLALNAGWDDELLAAELRTLDATDFDMGLIGFSDSELKRFIVEQLPLRMPGTEDDVPEPPSIATTQRGDVWKLAGHRVMCGDSTESGDVSALMAGELTQLIHADPPYGMGKEAVGVLNDNLYGDKQDAFQTAWWKCCRQFAAPNASAYIWGNAPALWRWWWRAVVDTEPMTFRNEIVWDKQSIAGMRSSDMTQYPEASERCLFFQLGRHVFLINQTKDDYWPGWEPLRAFLCAERDKAGFGPAEVKRICENHMYGHWFGTSQWAFISRDNYEKLAVAAAGKAFARPYSELLADYRRLAAIFNGEVRDPRAESFRAGRPFFDNAHDVMRDVWTFARVHGEERFDHATPKPVAMMERIMRSSLRDDEVALEPFGGTGSTLMGAQRTGRRCFSMELEPKYVDVTVKRWQSYTGLEAILETSGKSFKAMTDARTQTQTEPPANS